MQYVPGGTPGVNPNYFGAGEGGFQDGNPATGTQGTEFQAALWNDILGNLMNIMAVAGIAATPGRLADLSDAIKALVQQGHGQCQLQFSSNVLAKLMPKNGQTLKINGKFYQVPGIGVSIPTNNVTIGGVAAQNMAASTVYLAYMIDDGSHSGVMIPSLWAAGAYGHLPDTTAGNIGVEVRNNGGVVDSTHTFIGILMTDAMSHLSDFFTLSHFNKGTKVQTTTYTANRSTSSGSLVELNTEIRNNFICLAGDTVDWRMNGGIGGGNSNVYAGVCFDGGAAELQVAATAGRIMPAGTGDLKPGLSEGAHYLTALGAVDAGTLTLYAPPAVYGGGSPGTTPFTLTIAVRG
jgi:hypothetical protein